MSSKGYWLRSGFFSIGSKLSTLVFGFGTFFILVRTLPKADWGIWTLFLTVTSLIETSRNGLIQNALIKFLHSNPPESKDRIVTASWMLNSFFSVFIALFLFLAAEPVATVFDAPVLAAMLRWYILNSLLLIPISQFNYLQQAHFSFSGIFWTTAVRQGAFFILIIIFFLTRNQFELIQLVQYQILCTGLALVVAYISARQFLNAKFVLDWKMIRGIFNFGKYVMGTNIFSLAYKSTDQLLVGYFMNPTSVAYYNSAIRVSNLIEYPASSVAEIVYPKTTHEYELDKEKASKYFYEMGVGLTMTLTVPIIFFTVLLADVIVYIIAGEAYAESANIMRITILFGLFTPFTRQFGAAMDSSGRPQINFLILVVSVALNVALNIWGVASYGLMGAAYGTLASYIIMGIICYVIMYNIFRVSFKNILIHMISFYQKGFLLIKKKVTL